MRRRTVIALLGGAAATWPLAAGAQQATMPVIGFLHGGSLAAFAPFLDGFHRGLKESQKGRMSPSNTAGQRINTIDYLGWLRASCANR